MKKRMANLLMAAALLVSSPIAANAALPGDTNGDGTVSITEVQTVINAYLGLISEPANPLIGSWRGTLLGQAQSTVVVTFINDTEFFFAEDGDSGLDPTGQDGIERGTYSRTTTTFTPLVTVNTNGEWGLSGASGTPLPYSISNNVLTIGTGEDSGVFTKILPSTSNPLIGSWYGTALGQAQSSAVLTFVDDSTFVFAEDGNSTLDSSGHDGMENGSYTKTSTTWTPAVAVNTNGQWGLSDNTEATLPYTISNNVLILGTSPDTVSFTRVQ